MIRALDRRRLLMENRFYREELERKVRERTFELNEALYDVEESYKITLEALVTALDAREHETKAHSQRVREYTLTLAEDLGLKHDDLIQTGRGALLHDVGKIGVRDSILLKPGKLSEEEWVEMRMHPQIGYNILQNIEFLSRQRKSCCAIRSDGTGKATRMVWPAPIFHWGPESLLSHDGRNDQRPALSKSPVFRNSAGGNSVLFRNPV